MSRMKLRKLVTIQNPLSREAFWHVYAKIPRHARQNSIAKGDFIEFWLRICEGTEQIRKLFSGDGSMKFFHSFTDQELARLLDLVSMSDDDFFLRFPGSSDRDASVTVPDSTPAPEEH